MIDSLRKGFNKKIEINSFILSGDLYQLKSNDYGSTIENRSVAPTPKNYTNPVRITTRAKTIKKTNDSNTPVVFKDNYIMISDHETIVDERLEFTYLNNKFKVIKRIPFYRFDDVIGYEYELKDITSEAIYAA